MIDDLAGEFALVIGKKTWSVVRNHFRGKEPDWISQTATNISRELELNDSECHSVTSWLSRSDVREAIFRAEVETAEVAISSISEALAFEMGPPPQNADRIGDIVKATVLNFASFVADPHISVGLASTSGLHDHLRRDQLAIMERFDQLDSKERLATPKIGADAPSSNPRSPIAEAKLIEYRRRFSEFRLQELPRLVPIGATVKDAPVEVDDVLDLAAKGQVVAVVAKSGYGKTHLALHAAIRFANRGVNPIWIQAGEYRAGSLSALLSGATSTFGVAGIQDILDFDISATQTVIIADGFVGSPHERRLVEELEALRNQYPELGVIITSTVDASFPSTTVTLTLQATNDSTRTALFRSYQIPESIETGDAFRTPFEIAVFSKVYANLGPTVGFLVAHDAYIEQCCRHSTQLRHALRRIAGAMTEQIRTSLSRSSARQILEQAGVTPETIDAVFECPLLAPDVYNTRFIHDLHCERLAAEQIRANVTSASDFALALAVPRNTQLRDTALGLENDADWIRCALIELANTELLVRGGTGELGPIVKTQTRSIVEATLDEAVELTRTKKAQFKPGEHPIAGAWIQDRVWSGSEKAILSAAGQLAFKTGDFLGPILDLVDLTDDVLLEAIGTLRNQGVTNPITAVLAATYSGIAGGNPLPASLVFVRTVPGFARSNIVAATAYRGKGEKGWGRLTIALHAANSETNSAILPDLIIDAWNAGGYGLRIDALQCAARVIAKVTSESVQKIAEFLEGLDVDNVFYNSYIYEALSTAGKFVSDQTIESITTEVLELTNSFDDPAARALAYSLYSRQYEDIDFGPIGESIDQLAPEVRVRFLIMVAYSADSIWAGSALRELSQELPSNSDVSDLFRFHLQTFPAKLGFPQDAVERYVTAIVGWAQTNTHLPPATEGASITEYERAWWLLGELILQAVRDEEQSVAEPIWESLHKISSEAVDALYRLAENPMLAYVRGWPGIDVFVDRNPDHVRRLALFGIQPPLTLRSESDFGPSGHWRKVLIKTLGRCGDAETIDLLKIYIDDPTFGPVAVESIRSISDR